MLLTGTFPRSLDDKGRFSFPKRLRDALSGGQQGTSGQDRIERDCGDTPWYMAPGTDGSLALYTAAAFDQLSRRLEHSSPTAQGVRAFSRLFYAQAERTEMDRQGRIRIPQELVEWAGLGKEIVLVGVRDHLEIWDRDRWSSYLTKTQPCYDEVAEQAFGGGTNPTASPAPGAYPTTTAPAEDIEPTEGRADKPSQPR